MKKQLLTLAVALLFLGCATEPRIAVVSNTNPASDFSSMTTFNFMQPLGTDRPGGIQTPLSSMLISAMSDEMTRRGYRRASDPDLLINVFVATAQRLDVRQVPTGSSFHGYRRGRYSTWGGYRTEVREFTEGTLAIDLVDARASMLAWEGVAAKRLRSSTEINQETIDRVVAAVMDDFPFSAN